jgi:hypothetical protein
MEKLNNKVLNFNDFENLRLNEEEEKNNAMSNSRLYLLFVNRMSTCFETFRACIPNDLPDDVKKRKPELAKIIGEFNSLANIKNVFSGIDEDSGAEAHKEMWNKFENLGGDLKNKVTEFQQIYATRPDEPKRGESEERSDMQDRIRTGAADFKSSITAANTQAAAFVDAAVKIFTKGAKNVIAKLDDVALEEANESILRVKKYANKINENINEEKEGRKKGKKYVQETKEVSGFQLMGVYQSIYNKILNIRNIYRGSDFYGEIKGDIENYLAKTEVEKIYDFLTGIASDQAKLADAENRKKIAEYADRADKIFKVDGDLSLFKWSQGIEDKIGYKYNASETLKSGDAKIRRALSFIGDVMELALSKEKASQRNLDKLVDKLDSASEPKKDRIAGEGVTVIDPNGELTNDGRNSLNKKITDLLGVKEPNLDKEGQGENVGDLAYRLSFFSGNDYKSEDGKIDVDKLYKDLDTFTKNVVGSNAFKKFILNF